MSESESNIYDSEDDADYSDIVYEPEELTNSRFVISLCELYNNRIHGPGPNGHYLVHCRYKQLHMEWIEETSDFINLQYQYLHNQSHDLFPNYRQIVLSPNYVKPEIVECFDKDGYCIAIKKTFWIKIIQRSWRKLLKNRRIIQKSLAGLRHRELTGRWHHLPRLRGLLTR